MNYKKYFAELLGTFTLVFGVSVATGSVLPVPIVAGMIVMLFVYTIGGISGAHLNPAITIALFSASKINLKDATFYLVAQILGALLAIGLVMLMIGEPIDLAAENSLAIGVAEALGTALLAFGIAAVAHGHVKKAATGIVVGGSVLMGVILTAGISNGVINPAVALGLGSVSLMYVLGPIVGALAGTWAYKLIMTD